MRKLCVGISGLCLGIGSGMVLTTLSGIYPISIMTMVWTFGIGIIFALLAAL